MRELLAFLPYVARTARRARMRTALTVLGAALAMALFAIVRTVDAGVKDLAAKAAQPVLVVFQDSRFCPLTSELPVRYAPRIRDVPGVVEVLPTLVFVNSCRSNLDLVTLHGVDPKALGAVHELEFVAGDLASWQARSDAALVGERLAARRQARVGERIRLGEVDVHVSGIVRSKGAGIDNIAFVHLDQLALARRKLGSVTEFLVKLAPDASPEAVARAIDEGFRTDESRTDTKTMQAFVQAAVGEIAEVVEFGRVVGYLAVLVVAMVLANTVFISAQSRAAEMGVLETIGLTKPRLAALVALEGVGLGLLGGALGAGAVLAFLALRPTTLGVEGYGIDFEPSLSVALRSLLAALLMGILASIGPAIDAVRRPLAQAVKAE
jgi:putative ABC transport system permease protein